jgi:hypothetical protein
MLWRGKQRRLKGTAQVRCEWHGRPGVRLEADVSRDRKQEYADQFWIIFYFLKCRSKSDGGSSLRLIYWIRRKWQYHSRLWNQPICQYKQKLIHAELYGRSRVHLGFCKI